jgi:hypothetical protein
MMDAMTNANVVRETVEMSLAAGHFFVADPAALHVAHRRDQDVLWEMFGGHLLDAAHSAESRRFDAWDVVLVEDERDRRPVISVYWDQRRQKIHVVRRVLTHGHEAYEDSPGVILSRPAQKWLRELVGTIGAEELAPETLRRELETLLFLAVIGVSRLPITSLESPLPGFSLGQFAYFPSLQGNSQAPWRDSVDVLHAALAGGWQHLELVKALETALRAAPDAQQARIARTLIDFAERNDQGARQIADLLLGLFRYVALSPYGNYVERLIGRMATLTDSESVGMARIAETTATMLAQLGRHLTAFDLAVFHNAGANYPDALYLDGLLKLYFTWIDRQPSLFLAPLEESDAAKTSRLLRRGLRQGCLLRKHYEGLLVPDAPTSQGEAMRVLPEPFVRVPEEQISQANRRQRRLFVDDPLETLLTTGVRSALQLSLADLDHPAELRELGTAFFLDRPLGVAKRLGEVDRTPLVSYTAVSRAIIKRRLGELLTNGWLSREHCDRLERLSEQTAPCGVSVADLALVERPGVVSLADALKVSDDFVVLRSTCGDALGYYAWPVDRLPWPVLSSVGEPAERTTLVHHAPRTAEPTLRLYDSLGRLRFELGFEFQPQGGVRFVERSGVELPARLQALRAWEYVDAKDAPRERDLRGDSIWLPLRGEPS